MTTTPYMTAAMTASEIVNARLAAFRISADFHASNYRSRLRAGIPSNSISTDAVKRFAEEIETAIFRGVDA